MNVQEIVPLLGITDMQRSLAFYRDGLGFVVEETWTPEGELRWCSLRLEGVRVMLQVGDAEPRSEGVTLCVMCADALALYRAFRPVIGCVQSFSASAWMAALSSPRGGGELNSEPITENRKRAQTMVDGVSVITSPHEKT